MIRFKMKLVGIFLIALLAVGVISCTKDSTKPDEGDNQGTMTALIDGQKWDAEAITGTFKSKNLTVTGVSTNDGISITINKFNLTGPGTYKIPGDPLALAEVSVTIGTAGYHADNGTLKITRLTAKEVQGTFTANVVNQSNPNDTRDVTNGSFTAKF